MMHGRLAMPDEATNRVWDVIVIGTGIGGGTLGRRLAEQGYSVLFVEKGHFNPPPELHDPDASDGAAYRLQQGYWPTALSGTIDGQLSSFFGPVGSGVGGSSVFYAATLERPERHDIDQTAEYRHPTGGWPVSYDSFAPYFAAAEQAYFVRGSADPLSREPYSDLLPAIPFDKADCAMVDSFRKRGLNPYSLHVGIRNLSGCGFCFGRKCQRSCKMDARSAGVEPALLTGNAALLDLCNVTRLRSNAEQVIDVEASRDGQTFALHGRIYVLAAGAFGSPRILLASRSDSWPEGLANASGLVGRNLMFHLTEMIAIWPENGIRFDSPTRAIGLRDFYASPTQRYGTLQAMGVNVGYGEIVQFLNSAFDRSIIRKLRLLRHFTRIPAYLAAKIFGHAKVFAGIMEDLPYEQNRVVLDPQDPDRIAFHYTISSELKARRAEYKKLIQAGLRGLRLAFLNMQPELNFAHVCGTLRFGSDPKTSVLDPDCRAHGIANLFVADASFMPTSAGVNPSLTIAANALRVADKIATQLGQPGAPETFPVP